MPIQRGKKQIRKINIFQGDLADISAKKDALHVMKDKTLGTTKLRAPCACTPDGANVAMYISLMTMITSLGDLTEFSAKNVSADADQYLFLSRNIGQVTPIIIYFCYLKKTFPGSKHPKNNLFNLENTSADADGRAESAL